ncbi:hypothetical protein SAMN05216474_0778 [Lishizhenia tianjinensis]|uniref:Uncharacterized protein n=1 Tax=Lishizhenia tianjinensis TaxID=477690 RepID=A0A1I6YB52_9FLAO|nr:hypothetical protein [Lishizhenia tianjinensis]SFT47749.1 hypothetical protein SAMN05216474_0778 [Lishizhenia tianjinensis]
MKILILALALFTCTFGVQAQKNVQLFNHVKIIINGEEKIVKKDIIMTINDGLISISGSLDNTHHYRIIETIDRGESKEYQLKGFDGSRSVIIYGPSVDEQGNSLGNIAIQVFFDPETQEEIGRIIYTHQNT